MNWIFYSMINIAKFFALGGLYILSVIVIPVFGGIFILGMMLGFLKDVEPRFLPNKIKPLTLNFPNIPNIPNIKLDHVLLWSSKIVHFQHARIQRDRSNY